MWRPLEGVDFKNCMCVFPLMQRDVQKIVDIVKCDSNIKKVVIFGSSVSARCNPWSDIDVYFEMQADKDYPILHLDSPADKWNNFDVDATLLQEIEETGVIVYERE